LSATYYSDAQCVTPILTRTDSVIAFDAQNTQARATLPPNIASASWTGMLSVPKSDVYTLYVRAGAGVRLWLGYDPKPVIDAPSTDEVRSDPIALKAGQLYAIRLELRQMTSTGLAELRWDSVTIPKDIIPALSLYPSREFETFVGAFILLSK